VLSGLAEWRMVFDGRHKLIRGFNPDQPKRAAADAPPLLFDLESDPLENTNLADKAPGVVTKLSALPG